MSQTQQWVSKLHHHGIIPDIQTYLELVIHILSHSLILCNFSGENYETSFIWKILANFAHSRKNKN